MVRQTPAPVVASWLADGQSFEFVDVRQQWERDLAAIEGSELLTREGVDRLQTLPRDTRLVFVCHHGSRSYGAAVAFVRMGFTDVHNLVGGIEAWSAQVDPSIPRY